MRASAWVRATMATACVVVSVCCLLIVDVSAQGSVILDGVPTARVDSDGAQSKLTMLKSAERLKARVLIVQSDGRFWWATRENRELIYHESGVYHYFIDPLGGGYVKVYDPYLLPEALRDPGAKRAFYEHVSIGLATITYWGEAVEFGLGER